MVLTGAHHSYVFDSVRAGFNSNQRREYYKILKPENIILKLCKACQNNIMAAIPPSAFSAGRIRETARDVKTPNIDNQNQKHKFFNFNVTELTPLKYNSKLMNSIWGSYNRYSPHNVKKVNDVNTFHEELQRSAANSSTKNEAKLVLPTPKLDNVWASINISQSQI